jgi:hypothetical protein
VLPSIDLEKYSKEKILAAQLLSSKDENGMTDAQIAKEVGIESRTLYRWKLEPLFIELLMYYAELSMENFTAELYSKLKTSVRQGSTRAMELALKNRGKLIDKKEVSGNIAIEQTLSLTPDVLLSEIEELKRKLASSNKSALPAVKVIDADYEEL